MLEGVIRHGTTMTVEGSYTDTHGHIKSELGFGITQRLRESRLGLRQPGGSCRAARRGGNVIS